MTSSEHTGLYTESCKQHPFPFSWEPISAIHFYLFNKIPKYQDPLKRLLLSHVHLLFIYISIGLYVLFV